MKTACIACLLLIVALCSLTGEPLSLAIMGVEPIGTDRETAQILEELLLSSLAGRNIFTLVERERVDALLAEMELQVSGFTDASSVAEIGNLLNVQKVLFGSIGRYDAEYVEYLVSLRIVDVERGAIDVAGTFQVASKAVLKDSVEAMVSELIRGIKFAGKVMKSDPSGIYTDLGTDAGVVEGTRLSVSRYDEVKDDAGKVIMREEIPVANLAAESVSKEGSRARILESTEEIEVGMSVRIGEVQLMKSAGKAALSVDTIPPEARVFLDGDFMGLTPLRLSGLEPGSHRLEVRYGSGFRPYAAKISLREGRTLSVSKELMQEPDMRELLLMGKMPRRKTDPGTAVLRALLPGFGAYYNGYRTQAPIISIISLTGVGAFFGNGGFKPYETNLGGMVAQSFFLGLGVFFYLSSILDAWVTADDDFTYPVFTEISLGGLGGSVSTRQGGNSPPQFIDGLSTPFAGGDLWFLSDSRSYCVLLGVKYAGFGEMRINTDMYYRFLKLDPILIGFGLTSDMAAPFAPQGRTPAVHQWLLAPAISLSFRETRLAWDLAMTPFAAMQHQCYVVDPETLEIMLERKTGWGPPAFGIWAKLDARYFFTLDFGIRLSAGYGWFDVMEGTVSMYGATLENLSFFDAGIGVVLRF